MTNPLSDRLHSAVDDLPTRRPGGAAVRAAARSRQQRRRVVAGTALAAAVALIVVTVGEDAVGDRLLPASGTSSPSPHVSPPATTSPPGSPTPTPKASQSTTTRPSQPSRSVRPLADFRFPEEEETAWRRGTWTDVTVERSEDVRTPWVLDPCMPTDYPTDRYRVAMVSLKRMGPESFDGRQIAVYPDEATAIEVMAGFRRVLAACANADRSATGGPTQILSVPVDIGDEALLDWQVYFFQGLQQLGGGYDVVVRDGRSVYLASVGGEFQATGPTDEAATELVSVARAMLPLPQ